LHTASVPILLDPAGQALLPYSPYKNFPAQRSTTGHCRGDASQRVHPMRMRARA
jgi:hypothetical protein